MGATRFCIVALHWMKVSKTREGKWQGRDDRLIPDAEERAFQILYAKHQSAGWRSGAFLSNSDPRRASGGLR